MDDATTWGRVAEDGTVYVRTAAGERVVGSWHAGEPAAGLAHYALRYADLEAEVGLLEARTASGATTPGAAQEKARELRGSLDSAAVVGDIAALDARLGALLDRLAKRANEERAKRAEAKAAITAAREQLAVRAEELAQRKDWKATGDAFKALVDEWKALRGGDRNAESALWQRLSAARKTFDHRRRTHFAELDAKRGQAGERKEELAREAEKLKDSTEWADAAKKFKDLMRRWKEAGPALHNLEQQLWERFRGAQDAFFTARTEHFAKRDAEQSKNVAAREELLTEAERIDPERDLAGAESRLRDIQARWEKVERVPREMESAMEARLRNVEERVRDALDTERKTTRTVPDSMFVIRLRESIEALEAKAARGDAKAAEELVVKREWLAQAESSPDS